MQLLVLFFTALLSVIAFAKQNFCTITINSKDEREVFQSKLNPQDFNFVELTEMKDPGNPDERNWFDTACKSGIKCDVLLVSGHFGGNFFGESGKLLALKTLESKSCENRCAGILEKPKEVFLFGCNTLASKEADHRSPQQYLRALVEHGIDTTEAARIVAARYSQVGSSYGDRMRRVFEGVPLIYGFSSVGPSGKNVRSSLNKYLNEVGDYKAHLKSIEGGVTSNPTFEKNMKSYTTAIKPGVQKLSGSLYDVKKNSCILSDENRAVKDLVAYSAQLLESSPYIYFPAISQFLVENFPEPEPSEEEDESLEILRPLREKSHLKETIFKMASIGAVNPILLMDVLKFSARVGWIHGEEYYQRSRQIFKDLLAKPSLESADFFCSLANEVRGQLSVHDIDELNSILSSPSFNHHSIRMLNCMEWRGAASEFAGPLVDSLLKIDLKTVSPESLEFIVNLLRESYDLNKEVYSQLLKLSLPQETKFYEVIAKIKSVILRGIDKDTAYTLYNKFSSDYSNDLDSLELFNDEYLANSNLTTEMKVYGLKQVYNSCRNPKYDCYLGSLVLDPAIKTWITNNLDLSQNYSFTNQILKKMSEEKFAKKLAIYPMSAKLQDKIVSLVNHLWLLEKADANKIQTRFFFILLNQIEFTKPQIEQIYKVYQMRKNDFGLWGNFIRHMIYSQRGKLSSLNLNDFIGEKSFYDCKFLKQEDKLDCPIRTYQ